MDNEIYKADELFGSFLKGNNPEVLIGYHLWAKPVVKMMRQSKTITAIVKSIAMSWAEEMAHEMKAKKEGNIFGKIIMTAGMIICSIIGFSVTNKTSALMILTLILYLIFLRNRYKRNEKLELNLK